MKRGKREGEEDERTGDAGGYFGGGVCMWSKEKGEGIRGNKA